MSKDIIKVHQTYMQNITLKDRFDSILGNNAQSFMASVLNIIKSSDGLQQCTPQSVWNAALCSAAMHLPLDTGLGYAYIVPYKDNKNKVYNAQFQMGAKGYKQLALRTGEYLSINSTDVREGEIKKRNRLTGQIEFAWIEDDTARQATPIIGYVSYFELRNGYSSTFYMSMEELMEHAKKYSKQYQKDLKYGEKTSKWSIPEERGAMCEKTVSKLNLAKNGVLSIEMQRAMECDNSVIDENGNPVKQPIEGEGFEKTEANDAEKMTAEFSDVFESEAHVSNEASLLQTEEADRSILESNSTGALENETDER